MQAPEGNIRFFDEEISHERSIAEGLMAIPAEELEETVNMNRTKRKNWMRNKPCICGSGKKFKKCCWARFLTGTKLRGASGKKFAEIATRTG